MLVQDLMTSEVKTLRPDDSADRLIELLHEHNVRHVPVVDPDGELVGLATHRDLLRHTISGQTEMSPQMRSEMLASRRLDTLMSTSVMTVEPETPLNEAAELMLDNKIGCVPVVEGSRLVGILTEADFVRRAATET